MLENIRCNIKICVIYKKDKLRKETKKIIDYEIINNLSTRNCLTNKNNDSSTIDKKSIEFFIEVINEVDARFRADNINDAYFSSFHPEEKISLLKIIKRNNTNAKEFDSMLNFLKGYVAIHKDEISKKRNEKYLFELFYKFAGIKDLYNLFESKTKNIEKSKSLNIAIAKKNENIKQKLIKEFLEINFLEFAPQILNSKSMDDNQIKSFKLAIENIKETLKLEEIDKETLKLMENVYTHLQKLEEINYQHRKKEITQLINNKLSKKEIL